MTIWSGSSFVPVIENTQMDLAQIELQMLVTGKPQEKTEKSFANHLFWGTARASSSITDEPQPEIEHVGSCMSIVYVMMFLKGHQVFK